MHIITIQSSFGDFHVRATAIIQHGHRSTIHNPAMHIITVQSSLGDFHVRAMAIIQHGHSSTIHNPAMHRPGIILPDIHVLDMVIHRSRIIHIIDDSHTLAITRSFHII